MVNFAVGRHAFATVQRLEPGSGLVIYAMDLAEGVVADSVQQLHDESRLEFLTAFVKRMIPEGDSLLLATETDVPAGSGLGGSGALGVAIVAAIDRAYGRQRSPLETAVLANEIERKDLGYPGGDQDSLGAALGGVNFLEYHQGGGKTPHKVKLSDETQNALEQNSLLIYSGAAHVSGSIHEDIKESYSRENSPTVEAMIALRGQAHAMAKDLGAGDLDGYARALNESCRQLYNLHESCDSVEHRRYFKELKDCIVAGKTCGAGGGGFMLVLTKPGERQTCMRRVEALGGLVWPFTFDLAGVVNWTETPFGARALDRIRHLASK